jgi:hypothetical protein
MFRRMDRLRLQIKMGETPILLFPTVDRRSGIARSTGCNTIGISLVPEDEGASILQGVA